MQTVNGNHRIAHLLAPGPRAGRTEAQREAARRNGARSRGPRTQKGKARSRMNGLKHGLFARVIAPPADVRGDDQAFWRFRAELVEELGANTFSRSVLIDSIAADLVQIARARRMLESLQRPATIDPEDRELFDQVVEIRHELTLVQGTIGNLKTRQRRSLSQDDATRVAARVVQHLQATEAAVAEVDDPEIELDEYDRQELPGLKALLALAEPSRALLWDREALASALSGSRSIGILAAKRLLGALASIEKGLTRWLALQQDVERRLRTQCEKTTALLAREPDRLVRLQGYLETWERRVERKLRLLRAVE